MAVFDRARWQTLEPLLDQLLEIPVEERSDWLESLSRDSPELAADLAALLRAEASADERGFLAMPPDASLAGLELGAWRLERPLGQGGMGTVWLARRADGRFEGKAAVKILNLSLLSSSGQERFRREGSILARLTHPGIARLLDAGLAQAGQPYLVLEYVDGQPMDAFADERALSLVERIELFLQVLAAVEHAHAHLVVHRDLKPSNILVTADGQVKLLDFGIAKLLADGAGAAPASLNFDSGRVLTPRHAAPEQVRGEPLTTATDVYALGVLLYLLVSGRHPTSELAHTPVESVRTLLEVEPARLHLGDLDNILAKTLRKVPAERYQTVAPFADDLERYLRAEPVSARGHSVGYRMERFLRRNAAAVAIGIVVASSLVGATAYSLLQRREAERQRDVAQTERERADAQVEFQNVLLSSVGERPMTMREILDSARSVLEEQAASDPKAHLAILLQLAGSYRELGATRVRATLLARAESLATTTGDEASLAHVRCDEADLQRKEGNYEKAALAIDSADAIARASHDPATIAYCQDVRAVLAGETGHGDEAVAAARRAVAIKDSLGETHESLYFDMVSDLAYALEVRGQPREAADIYRRIIAAKDSSGQGATVNQAVMRHNLALTLVDIGETAEAEQLFHGTLAKLLRSDRTGWVSPQALIHYAEAALTQGHADSALEYFGLVIDQAIADSSLWWEGRGRFGQARAQVKLGLLDDATRSNARLARILRLYPETRNSEDVVADANTVEGMLALARGDAAAASASFQMALRTNGYFAGENRRKLRPVVLLAAQSALLLGETRPAITYARQAIEIARVDSLADFRSADVGEARLVEGKALLAEGDTTNGRAAIMHGLTALRVGAGRSDPRTQEAEALASLFER